MHREREDLVFLKHFKKGHAQHVLHQGGQKRYAKIANYASNREKVFQLLAVP
jgi:hypothetical protein